MTKAFILGILVGKQKLIEDVYNLCKRTILLKNVSFYSAENYKEFFSEIFVLKTMKREPFPSYFEGLFKEVGL